MGKHGKDNNIVNWFNPAAILDNLTSSLGALVAMFPQSFHLFLDFPTNHKKLVIPAASGGKGEKERVGKAFSDLAKLLFEGTERDEVTTDKTKVAILETFRAKGFKFTCYSYAAVSEGIKLRLQKQVQAIALQRDMTRKIPENKVAIEQTNTIRAIRKIVKDEGNAAAIAYIEKMKVAKLLPAIIES